MAKLGRTFFDSSPSVKFDDADRLAIRQNESSQNQANRLAIAQLQAQTQRDVQGTFGDRTGANIDAAALRSASDADIARIGAESGNIRAGVFRDESQARLNDPRTALRNRIISMLGPQVEQIFSQQNQQPIAANDQSLAPRRKQLIGSLGVPVFDVDDQGRGVPVFEPETDPAPQAAPAQQQGLSQRDLLSFVMGGGISAAPTQQSRLQEGLATLQLNAVNELSQARASGMSTPAIERQLGAQISGQPVAPAPLSTPEARTGNFDNSLANFIAKDQALFFGSEPTSRELQSLVDSFNQTVQALVSDGQAETLDDALQFMLQLVDKRSKKGTSYTGKEQNLDKFLRRIGAPAR